MVHLAPRRFPAPVAVAVAAPVLARVEAATSPRPVHAARRLAPVVRLIPESVSLFHRRARQQRIYDER